MNKIVVLVFFVIFIFSISCSGDIGQLRTTVTNFYNYRKNHQSKAITDLCSPEFLMYSSKIDFLKMLDTIDCNFGTIKSFGIKDFYVKTVNLETFYFFTYQVKYDKGNTTEDFSFIEGESGYKLLYFSYECDTVF